VGDDNPASKVSTTAVLKSNIIGISEPTTMWRGAALRLLLPIVLLLATAARPAAAAAAAANEDEEDDASIGTSTEGAVTVLGLGKMGTAVLQCLVGAAGDSDDEHPYDSAAAGSSRRTVVHAWNRGVEKRRAVADLESVTVHETPRSAVASSPTTLILIDDWPGTVQLVRDLLTDSDGGETTAALHNKTFVLFSTYTPTDIQEVERELFSVVEGRGSSITLVGGAIVGVPQTICSEQALILTSANVPVLLRVGRTVAFSGGDVGLAALCNMALILVITFGIAGQELALLIIRQYGVDQHFLDTYTPLAAEIGPSYIKMLLPAVSKAVTNRGYERSYVPVGVFRKVLQMHVSFMDHLGIASDTFLASYLRYLQKITNEKHGPAAWTELATNQTNNPAQDEL